MREYKFRGKRIDNGEWVYGYYAVNEEHSEPRHQIFTKINCGDFISHEIHQVDPQTVGQYTVLNDKNGKEIYEGDIVKRASYVTLDKYDGFVGIVKFLCAAFMIESIDGKDGKYLWDDVQELEVIGNIYANPELLKQGG